MQHWLQTSISGHQNQFKLKNYFGEISQIPDLFRPFPTIPTVSDPFPSGLQWSDMVGPVRWGGLGTRIVDLENMET